MPQQLRSLGTTPIFKRNALGVESPCSEQLSELWGILRAILRAIFTTQNLVLSCFWATLFFRGFLALWLTRAVKTPVAFSKR